MQALDSIYAEAVFKANALRRKRVSIEIIKAAVRRNSWQYAIDELKAGNFRDFIPDDYGYRVHTAFSQLKREFRCMVTYNGEQLVEVDIKNSQLYFMVYLLNGRNWNIRGESDEKTRKIWKGITTPTIDNKHPYTHTIMFLKSLESKYSKGFHEHDFVRSVTEGTLYESIMEKLMLSAGGTAKLSWYNNRDDVKKVLLMQLFADRWKHANSLFNCNSLPVWKTFETLYPDIGKIIREVKADYFKHISMLLQRIESMAVFGVCEHLFRHFPDVPYFTIHDCIVTMERNALTVKAVMEKCITDFIGCTKAGS